MINVSVEESGSIYHLVSAMPAATTNNGCPEAATPADTNKIGVRSSHICLILVLLNNSFLNAS